MTMNNAAAAKRQATQVALFDHIGRIVTGLQTGEYTPRAELHRKEGEGYYGIRVTSELAPQAQDQTRED